MTITELRSKLDALGVPHGLYSLDGVLIPDRFVLFNSYDSCHVFYLDERGNRNNEQIFDSESEACEFVYKLFKNSIKW